MNKYIDAEKLEDKLIEIEERHPAFGERLYDNAYSNCLSEVRLIISSLLKEQEQPDYKEAVQLVFEEKLIPFKDGNQWCFLLGRNIQEGVCGFGDTILDAAIDFYKDYSTTRIHIGELKKTMEQLKEQPQGLDEAAEALADEHGFVKRPSCKPAKYSYQSVRNVFIEAAIAGAKWMAEQLESYKNLQSQEK